MDHIDFMSKGRPLTETALIILGHGSTKNNQSSLATRSLAEEIRERGIFAEVHAAFWKEEPEFNKVFELVSCEDVYIVPHFISEGYFTQDVIPREFDLDGKLTLRDDFCIRYCEPVGNHPGMTDLLLNRAREVAVGVDPAEISLLVLGHGTQRNDESARAVCEQVEKIQNGVDGFGEVMGVYLDEPPRLKDWYRLTNFENVVVLPYFIAEGLHFSRDLPKMLGLKSGASGQPYEIRSRKVYCASPVGGDPAMADMVIDQVSGFES